jgi:DNA modification methylase
VEKLVEKKWIRIGRSRLGMGDCLDGLMELEDNSVKLVLTDPPYMIGASSVGKKNSKSGLWVDMMNSSSWYTEWFRESSRVLMDTGYLVSFCNWRSLPTIMFALSKVGLAVSSCLVWDKDWIGPASKVQLRPRYELVVFVGMKNAEILDRSKPDIWKHRWMAVHCKTTPHPAEKPEPLMREIIELLTVEGDLVVDPFLGSGTTGVACHNSNRRFVGIDANLQYFEIARQRLVNLMHEGEV